ncbi:hypothetical protein JTB14_010975 [Gonioctena quinquepunctata]|nr:hypothetical protein JTB14_010975 [Gonioctena quinquepunctata]
MPDIASKYIYSPDGFFLQLYLSGMTIFTTKGAKDFSIKQRKCRFHHESNLPHSPVYSYDLCRMECRATLAKKLCGCVPHFYRKLDDERTCDVGGLHCISKYKAKTRCRRLTRLQLRMAECSNPNGRVCPLSRRGLCEGDTMSRARPTLDFS